MTLNSKQAAFTRCLGKLLTYATESQQAVIIAEAYRTPEQARIYAAQGKGIINSTHTRKLAVDLFRYKRGSVSWDVADYADLGRYWKTLDKRARWGGDFKSRDAVHFSFEHQGVK